MNRHVGIKKQPDGSWKIRTSATDPKTGKLRWSRATLPPGTTAREAQNVRDKLKNELRSGTTVAPPRQITLADYAEQWLAQMAARLKPSTLERYTTVLARQVLPALGEYRVGQLTRGDVDLWARTAEGLTFEREGEWINYSTDTLKSWWRVLIQLLRDAHAEGLVQIDPTLRVPPPETRVHRRREQRTLSVDELGALLRAVPENRYAEVTTLAWTGMRPGELYALTWEDVDLRGQRIFIRSAVWRGSVGTTKTDAEREVPISDELVAVLDSHRRLQLVNQVPGLDLGLVFPSDVGTHRTASSLTKALESASSIAEIDQRVTPQVLRRTWNTLLTAAGVDRIVVRSMLGHSSEKMTERYSGVRLERKREAVGLALKDGGKK